MGTRSGDVDPAILGFIAAKEGLSLHEVETMLNKQSGLLGISGLTHDMRVLQEEVTSLSAALEAWVQGGPVIWPAPAGTPLDRVVDLLRVAAGGRASHRPSWSPSQSPPWGRSEPGEPPPGPRTRDPQ